MTYPLRHHLDLLRVPGQTRRRLRGQARLGDLVRLRRWDLGGRSPRARVGTIADALEHLAWHADAARLFSQPADTLGADPATQEHAC